MIADDNTNAPFSELFVGNSWYTHALGGRPVNEGGGVLRRGWRLFWQGRSYPTIVTTASGKGSLVVALLLSLCRQRKLILLEFLPGRRQSVRGRLARLLWSYALRHSAQRIHVLTSWEVAAYAREYRVSPAVFAFIPWPLSARPGEFPATQGLPRTGVVVSGRNSCDWETLFEAAAGQDWNLTVICGSRDRARVEALMRQITVRLLVDVPPQEHFARVRAARVYALPLSENLVSSGHIRLMTAIAARTPIVASAVRGLADYLKDTAVPVPAGDALALRREVNRLLTDDKWAEEVACAASQAAARSTWDHYIRSLQTLVAGGLENVRASAATRSGPSDNAGTGSRGRSS